MTNARWLGAAIAVCVSCGDAIGPGTSGRWAGPRIELVMAADGGELRLPCVRPARLARWTRFDAEGRIQFAGAVREQWYTYDFVFSGHLRGDTLAAVLTVSTSQGESYRSEHVMTRDADPRLGAVGCLAVGVRK